MHPDSSQLSFFFVLNMSQGAFSVYMLLARKIGLFRLSGVRDGKFSDEQLRGDPLVRQNDLRIVLQRVLRDIQLLQQLRIAGERLVDEIKRLRLTLGFEYRRLPLTLRFLDHRAPAAVGLRLLGG